MATLTHDELEAYVTGKDLVPVPLNECPRCTGPLEVRLLREDALFVGADYGATRRVETFACGSCGFSRVVGVGHERPPRT